MNQSQPQSIQNQSFLNRHLSKIILGGLVCLALLIVFGILTAVYYTTHILFPAYISFGVSNYFGHLYLNYLDCTFRPLSHDLHRLQNGDISRIFLAMEEKHRISFREVATFCLLFT